MSRRSQPEPFDDALDPGSAAPDEAAPDGTTAIDFSSLSVAGITRRRITVLASAMLAAWIVIAFARQVGDASAAATRAQDIASGNAALRLEVAAMERELDIIGRQRFVEQAARAYGVGSVHEIPFALEPDVAPLPPDAPGSAAVRLGSRTDDVSPLERWLTVLFGPSG